MTRLARRVGAFAQRWLGRGSVLLLAAAPTSSASCGGPMHVGVAGRIQGHVDAVVKAHAPWPAPPPPEAPGAGGEGDVPLVLTADGGAAAGPQGGGPGEAAVVSAGVPFPPGALRDPGLISLRDGRGAAVPVHVETLATWPADGSIRSALVAFRARLRPGERALHTLHWGAPCAARAKERLAANPDGPITATLPPSWYAASRVSGPQVPAMDNGRFPDFEGAIERGLEKMSPRYDEYEMSCGGKHRTYYDGPHALYQRFLRNGDAGRFRRARAEARWYRDHELRFSPDRRLAVHVCQKPETWTPNQPLSWGVIRRMLGQGMLDDWLLTGDPAARDAVIGIGEAIRQNLPALRTAKEDALQATERNTAWSMMALASHYAIDPRPEVRDALRDLVDRTIAWQARGTSGAFEHDLSRADPDECERGPRGGSPFMTALLVDALMDYHALTGDERVREVVARAATWLDRSAATSDRKAFRYLWGCETDPYDDSGTADLNLLIVPVFGAAYALTREPRWLEVGDAFADAGVSALGTRTPKHWNQAMRGFGRYLGYRALAAAPPGTKAQAEAAAKLQGGPRGAAPPQAPVKKN